jgi:hypothetical protein
MENSERGFMAREPIPDNVRRFILACIPSVPYLEAMLLLRNEPDRAWDSKAVAQRLYMSEKNVAQLLAGLHASGILVIASREASSYRYYPESEDLRLVIDQLADTYSRRLVDVTHLIHSKTGKRAQQFADAFKWRKDS